MFSALLMLAGTQAASATLDIPQSATADEWISACARDTDPDDCRNYVVGVATDDAMTNICLPPTVTDADALVQRVIGWIGTHPEAGKMKFRDGIFLALKTLYPYPCG